MHVLKIAMAKHYITFFHAQERGKVHTNCLLCSFYRCCSKSRTFIIRFVICHFLIAYESATNMVNEINHIRVVVVLS